MNRDEILRSAYWRCEKGTSVWHIRSPRTQDGTEPPAHVCGTTRFNECIHTLGYLDEYLDLRDNPTKLNSLGTSGNKTQPLEVKPDSSLCSDCLEWLGQWDFVSAVQAVQVRLKEESV